MSLIHEKVSYLAGLCDGLDIDETSKEGKLLKEIINVLGAVADEVEYLGEIVESNLGDDFDAEDDFDQEDDMDYFEVECDRCSNKVIIDEEMLESDDDIVCPVCHNIIEIEFEEGDCDCGHCAGDCE